MKLAWQEHSPTKVWQWLVQKKVNGQWTTEILPGTQAKEIVSSKDKSTLPETIEVSAVDRCGISSEAAVFNTAHLQN